MLALFFVQAAPKYFTLGVAILALGSVIAEVAGVNYNAMLVQVTTPRTMGRVSGLGWGLGYIGGIVALVIVVVSDALRLVWPRHLQRDGVPPDSGGLRRCGRSCSRGPCSCGFRRRRQRNASPTVADCSTRTWCCGATSNSCGDEARPTLWFLLASAVYRDGLAGVFAFGAVIAARAYDFTDSQVILFGIAASLIAGVSTIIAGRFDDRFGPRRVIIAALSRHRGRGARRGLPPRVRQHHLLGVWPDAERNGGAGAVVVASAARARVTARARVGDLWALRHHRARGVVPVAGRVGPRDRDHGRHDLGDARHHRRCRRGAGADALRADARRRGRLRCDRCSPTSGETCGQTARSPTQRRTLQARRSTLWRHRPAVSPTSSARRVSTIGVIGWC